MKLAKTFGSMRNRVVTGALILLPLITTIYVFVKLFGLADSVMPTLFHTLLPRLMPPRWIPGVGVVVAVAIAYFTGLAARNFIGKYVIDTGNHIISTIPIVSKIYFGIQQILDATTKANKRLFERPVLVEFPRRGIFCIGFITSTTTGEIRNKIGADARSIFVPTTPNPTSGFLLYMLDSDIVPLEMSVETAIKLVMSAGIVNSDQLSDIAGAGTPPKGWNWLHHITNRHKRNPGADGTA